MLRIVVQNYLTVDPFLSIGSEDSMGRNMEWKCSRVGSISQHNFEGNITMDKSKKTVLKIDLIL